LEQFQEKCETVVRPELRKSKWLGWFNDLSIAELLKAKPHDR
jgi:hypothetical protein